jgi:Histidine kinase-, DNA gyrase B-, and HSP90-like ATPase
MAPYREHQEKRAAAPAPLPGLVADMVRQFADPYAFLRELVQNGMDAGAHRIAVRLERMPGAVCATSVADDGSGMSREDIEGPLLTLFSSSKEGDAGKIGKYGVGFVSVFAVQPERVEVETWSEQGAYRLHLRSDGSYELEEAEPRGGSGTRVTLLQPMDRASFREHAARARAALRRWCRHALCEIELRVADHEDAEAGAGERIDTPLSVFSPVSVTAAFGDTTLVVGLSAGAHHLEAPEGLGGPERAPRFAGFYNRGLTLFETADEVFGGLTGVRFKAMSPRFQHTLSRDNVRRDEAFWEALARARELVRGPLRRELAARLGPAAAAAATGRGVSGYLALLEAALSPPTALDPDEIAFPLASPLGGALARAGLRALAPGRAPLLTAEAPDALTEALAREGRPVVLCGHPAIAALLERCFPKLGVEAADAVYLLVREAPLDPGGGDAALLAVVAGALARARRGVARVSLCAIEGAHAARAAIFAPAGGEGRAGEAPRRQRLLPAAREVEQAAARGRPRLELHLNVASGTVSLARRRAAVDPVTAGTLLARAVLVEAQGAIAPEDSDRLLEWVGDSGIDGDVHVETYDQK